MVAGKPRTEGGCVVGARWGEAGTLSCPAFLCKQRLSLGGPRASYLDPLGSERRPRDLSCQVLGTRRRVPCRSAGSLALGEGGSLFLAIIALQASPKGTGQQV